MGTGDEAERDGAGAADPALTVGATVHRLREQRGWSLQRLASTAHISKQHLWDIERGAARPNELAIKNLARALGARIADLMGETGPEEYARHISPSLREFARRRGLGAAQVEALASLNYRGRAPQTVGEWEMIWRLLRAVLDDEGAGGAAGEGA
jgi:transcriptional regulator with XRE-family HTH domain